MSIPFRTQHPTKLGCQQQDATNRLRIIHTGVVLFERVQDWRSGCPFRLVQSGLRYLGPHLTKRVIHVSQADFCRYVWSTQQRFNYENVILSDGTPTSVVHHIHAPASTILKCNIFFGMTQASYFLNEPQFALLRIDDFQ